MIRTVINWLRRDETPLFITFASAFACLGLMVGSIGPALLEIASRTDTPVSEVGLLVTVRGLSYALGSALGGPLFDKYDANRLLAVSLTTAALGTGAITFVTNIWGIGALILTQGLCMGLLDTGGNVCVLWIYSDINPEPYLQALHFMFATGALVAPIIVGVVMDAYRNSFDIAFYVIGSSLTPVIISLALLQSPAIKKAKTESPTMTLKERILGQFKPQEKIVITLAGLFLGIYVGAEVSMGTLVYTYAVQRGLSEQTGYLLNSVFWSAIAIGRLLAIPISTKLTSQTMLLVNIIGCMACTFCLMIFDTTITQMGPNQTLITLWVCVPMYGLFMSSCFPTIFTLAEEMMHVSGKAASFFVVGSSLGEMAFPALVTLLFATSIGDFSLVLTCFVCAIGMFLAWIGFYFQKRSMEKRNQLKKQTIEQEFTEETPLQSKK